MKTYHSAFLIGLTAIIAGASSPGVAQTVDTSTGTVSDSSTSASAVPNPNPPPAKLVANLVPAVDESKARGNLAFTLAGDVVSVSGRIDGLTPNKSYQLALNPSINPGNPAATTAEEQKGRPGPPAAGIPESGAPSAGIPAAGKPDGEPRPGAPGAGNGGTPAPGKGNFRSTGADNADSKPSDAITIVTADSMGGANINATIRNAELNDGPNGILGRTALVNETSADNQPTDGVTVSSGVIATEPLPNH